MDKTSIVKDGKTYVEGTIVSYDVTRKYIVGLRLKLQPVVCGDTQNTMVTNTKMYFVLNKANGNLIHYTSEEKFKAKLTELDIADDVELDYSQLDFVWKYESTGYNYSAYRRSCQPK
ncbi:hypothetical protein [Kordiimonas pumila]|uniref:Uncharacterized protein n=1 Tax=Kordiimonas pumila TaxID=2161677 RepID=A0ABV7D875_9PROT|nr:hypothetical protein [Kordiimonas pumila]